jgi:hypothetical protein
MKSSADAPQMLTAGKIAEQVGFPAGKVKKAMQELNIEPSLVKGGCNYYSTDCIEQLKKVLN